MKTTSTKLEIEISGSKFSNPVFLASGTAGFGFEVSEIFDISKIGGIITKTITPNPKDGNLPPRVWETPAGMLNSIGLANPGIRAFLLDVVPELAKIPTGLVVSVGGTSEDEFCDLVELVSELDFIKAIELNFSCPNVKRGGMHFGRDCSVVSSLLKQLKNISDKPLWAKLSPQVTDIVELGLAVQNGGADAIVITNTLPAMTIDIQSRKPHLGAITGGLSGPAIHPVAVALIYRVAQKVSIPIIGTGGIGRPEDAIEMMIAGASAIQIGSGYFSNTLLPLEIVSFIEEYLDSNNYESITDIIGSVVSFQ